MNKNIILAFILCLSLVSFVSATSSELACTSHSNLNMKNHDIFNVKNINVTNVYAGGLVSASGFDSGNGYTTSAQGHGVLLNPWGIAITGSGLDNYPYRYWLSYGGMGASYVYIQGFTTIFSTETDFNGQINTGLSGQGNSFACIDSKGFLFRSNTPCR